MAAADDIPSPAIPILDLIRVTETGYDDRKAYDTIYGHHEDDLDKPVTAMTVRELQYWQPGFSQTWGSSASGAYQFMHATLGDLVEQLGLTGDEIFNPALQDQLGYELLLRRGYEQWAAFEDDTDTFMIGLAQEWASFPVPYDMQGAHRWVTRGQSYYAGDGVNQALISSDEVWLVCEQAREQPKSEDGVVRRSRQPEPPLLDPKTVRHVEERKAEERTPLRQRFPHLVTVLTLAALALAGVAILYLFRG